MVFTHQAVILQTFSYQRLHGGARQVFSVDMWSPGATNAYNTIVILSQINSTTIITMKL